MPGAIAAFATVLLFMVSSLFADTADKNPQTGKSPRTYVFAMNQVRVTLGKQYLHAYLDRPLLFDRALDRPGEIMTSEGFLADAGAVRRSGLDGFCLTCAWPYKVRMGLMAYQFADQAGRKGEPTPCDRTGFLIEPMVFGGFGDGAEWFDGYLISFSVVHGG